MSRYTLVLLLSVCGLLCACQKQSTPAATAAHQADAGRTSGDGKTGNARGGKPQPVTTLVSRVEDVPLLLEAQGNVLALDEVDIRPQKNGMITEIHVKEGDEVKRGQLLFSLDARDDDANVGKAAAAVTSAEASLTIAERDLKRSQELSDKAFISPSALDTTRSKADTAVANLTQARAALEQAKVSLSYTKIHAPFDGRIGVINVRPGSLVTSSSSATALVRLTRMNPIGVSFSLAERDIPSLLGSMRKGAVKLTAYTAAQGSLPGEVTFVDNNVDKASGTLLVKGRLDNSSRLVWPGQYVSVKIAAGSLSQATVLPAQAVLNSANGRLVYVVQDDGTVQAQPVELLRVNDEKAVVKGLTAGLKIVIEGGQNLRPGSKVSESKGEHGGKRRDKGASDQSSRAAASSAPAQPDKPQAKAASGADAR